MAGKYITERKGSNINFPGILWLLGRISRGEGDGNFGEGNKDFFLKKLKGGSGKNINIRL